jgi:hypothetical protein
MDPFNKLPTEIVLCILHHTTDFVGLDSLLCVSPWIRAVFQTSALQITEDILAGCPYTWRLESLFRTSTLIRTPAFQCSTFHEFHKRTRDTPAFIKAWNDDQFSHSKTLRSMIRVAARVQRLSCAVISTMLNNLRLAGESSSVLPPGWEGHGLAPSSWIEDYRVYRAIWVLQVYSDLHRATTSETVEPNNSQESSWGGWSWDKPKVLDIPLYAPLGDIRQTVREEVETVDQILQDLVTSTKIHPPPLDLHLPFFPSLEMKEGVTHPLWPARQMPTIHGVDSWKRSQSSTCTAGIQRQVFQAIKRNSTLFESDPRELQDRVQFQDRVPLRKLGIFLWDIWRLNAMGLCNTLTRTNTKAPDGSPYVPIPAGIQNKATQERWLWLVQLDPLSDNVA